jgi:hypothetical protein
MMHSNIAGSNMPNKISPYAIDPLNLFSYTFLVATNTKTHLKAWFIVPERLRLTIGLGDGGEFYKCLPTNEAD